MFGLSFLSRKLGVSPSSSGTTGTVQSSIDAPSPAAEPPLTPSPPPQDLITDPNPLHTLIASVPAQTLHAYTLAHLLPPSEPLSPLSFPHIPLPSDPPSPRTLTGLTNFFSNLVPPPHLHCVRCHKGYFEVENTDRSCLVPHDDESAEVERVGASSRSKGIETEYETLWGCCGKTVEGDGDMGPPDGWCYEGKHTPDIKRARFRIDSTPHNDKLTSCERLKCHRPRSSSTASSPHAPRSRAGKRRRATIEGPDNEDTQSSAGGSAVSESPANNIQSVDDASNTRKRKRARHSKSTSISSSVDVKQGDNDDVTMMDAEGSTSTATRSQPQVPATPNSPPRPRKSRKSVGGGPTTPGARARAKAKSPLASSFTPPSPPAEDDVQMRPPPLPRTVVVEITTEGDGSPKLANSKSNSELCKPSSSSSLKEDHKADSDAQPDKPPKRKPRARKSTATTAKPASKRASSIESPPDDLTSSTTVKPKSSSSSTALKKTRCSVASLKSASTNAAKPVSTASASTESTPQKPLSKSGSVRKRRGKALAEVVATSIEGEENS